MEVFMPVSIPFPTPRKPTALSMFTVSDEISINRLGKKIMIKGRDGTTQESDTVEANLLFEMLKCMKRK